MAHRRSRHQKTPRQRTQHQRVQPRGRAASIAKPQHQFPTRPSGRLHRPFDRTRLRQQRNQPHAAKNGTGHFTPHQPQLSAQPHHLCRLAQPFRSQPPHQSCRYRTQPSRKPAQSVQRHPPFHPPHPAHPPRYPPFGRHRKSRVALPCTSLQLPRHIQQQRTRSRPARTFIRSPPAEQHRHPVRHPYRVAGNLRPPKLKTPIPHQAAAHPPRLHRQHTHTRPLPQHRQPTPSKYPYRSPARHRYPDRQS